MCRPVRYLYACGHHEDVFFDFTPSVPRRREPAASGASTQTGNLAPDIRQTLSGAAALLDPTWQDVDPLEGVRGLGLHADVQIALLDRSSGRGVLPSHHHVSRVLPPVHEGPAHWISDTVPDHVSPNGDDSVRSERSPLHPSDAPCQDGSQHNCTHDDRYGTRQPGASRVSHTKSEKEELSRHFPAETNLYDPLNCVALKNEDCHDCWQLQNGHKGPHTHNDRALSELHPNSMEKE